MSIQENGIENDAKPLVGRAVNNRSMWIFGGLMVLAAIGLFSILEARRSSVAGFATEPSVETGSGFISSPPDLAMPGGYGVDADAFRSDVMTTAPRAPAFLPQTLPGVPNTPNNGRSVRIPSAPVVRISPYIDQGSPDPVLPLRSAAQPADLAPDDSRPISRSVGAAGTLTRINNPSTTVPQGALIQDRKSVV